MNSSWKLEISAAMSPFSGTSSASLLNEIPILPASANGIPELFIMSPRSVVVVVFPFVPVTARIGALVMR